jgi:hypothetical protein
MVSRFSRRFLSGVFLASALLGAGEPAVAGPFPFFWEEPERKPPEQGLGAAAVKSILAREGARLVGKPRRRGAEIIANGVDSARRTRRFTLDAVSGEVLNVEVIAEAPPEKRKRAVEPGDASTPPGQPLGPPVHAGDEPAPEPGAARAPPAEAKPASPDAALSPVRPLRPAGAPKVEPLPK